MNELLDYRRQLLDRWQAVVDDIRQVLAQFPDDRLHHPLTGETWTPHQIAAHLRDVEAQAMWPRLERILHQDAPTLENFDEQAWMRQRYRPEEPLEDILAEYAALRARQIALLRDISLADWSRTGRHPWWGSRTLQWWVERSLAHAEEHLAQLQRGLAEGNA